jgi:AcrR family transcriptional regulator
MAKKTVRKSGQEPAALRSGRKASKPSFIEQARRKQILDISAALFSSKGFNSTSIEEIAAEADVSRGVIFYYFDGKKELGEETVRQGLRNYGNYVQERVAGKRTAREKLLEFVDACIDYTNEHRNDYLMYVDTLGCFGSSEDNYSMLENVNQRTRVLLVDLIEEGKAAGEIGQVPSTELADIIQGVVDGLMALGAVEPAQVNLKGCKQLLRKMLINTIEQ